MFLDERVGNPANAGVDEPHGGAKQLSVLAPNINVVKFCLYPVLIAELVYRQRPDRVALLQATNAEGIARESKEFIALMNQLDIVRHHRAVFLGRHETPAFLAGNTDIVISHQRENPLNYLYLEVCWQGYPLIHNAYLCADLGYYYRDNGVEEGARKAIEAIESHDAHTSRYREKQRREIARYRPDNRQLVATYAALLDDLVARPLR